MSALGALAVTWVAAGVAPASRQAAQPQGDAGSAVEIQSFRNCLAGVRTANADVRLSVGRDSAIPGENVLIVDYPPPTGDPAGRDVQCVAEQRDWTSGSAIAFQIKPDHDTRISVSFLDRNRVVYTSWRDLTAGAWQLVRLPFSEMRPNPFFQPPDAGTGLPIDVSDVAFIAFAPQDRTSGRLTLGKLVAAM